MTNKELFEPKIMYFRLCNSPEIFERIINNIFRELLHKGVLANYINSFVIPAKTRKELEKRTIWFLKIAEKYNFCFKWLKYNFNIEKLSILEVVVRREEVQIENNKIKVVKEWKTFTKIKKKVESLWIFTDNSLRISVI